MAYVLLLLLFFLGGGCKIFQSESTAPLAKQEATPTESEEAELDEVPDRSSEDLPTPATSAAIESLATSAAIGSSSSAGAIEALKEHVREYEEDLVELSEATGGKVKVPQGSTNLSKQVARLIASLEKAAEAEDKELQAETAFKVLDLNSDGYVTTDELLRSLTVRDHPVAHLPVVDGECAAEFI